MTSSVAVARKRKRRHPLDPTPANFPCGPVAARRHVRLAFKNLSDARTSDDWGEFCHNTSRPLTTRKTVKTPPPSNRKVSHHKNAANKGTLAPELLFQANPHRFVLFPIQHDDIWRMYKKAEASYWTAEEIDLSSNAVDWD